MYYSYVLIYRREWGEIRHYFKTRADAEKENESGCYAGCGTGTIQSCYRKVEDGDYERIHYYN
jgi:hypothetical protein